MAQLFAMLSSREHAHADIELPLSLHAPKSYELDLASCPHVYENGHYDLSLTLDLVELERLVQIEAQALRALQDAGNEDDDEDANGGSGTVSAAKAAAIIDEGNRLHQEIFGRYGRTIFDDDADDDDEDVEDDETGIGGDGGNSTVTGSTVTGGDAAYGAGDGYGSGAAARGDLASFNNNSDFVSTIKNEFGQYKFIRSINLEINEQLKGNFIVSQGPQSTLVHAKAVFSEQSSINNNQPFLLQYDALYLHLIVKFKDGTKLSLYTNFILCSSNNKEDNENINQILRELTELEKDEILDLMFKSNDAVEDTQSDVTGTHRAYQSLSSYVNLVESVVDCYKNNFGSFKALAKHVIIKDDTVLPFDKVRTVTHKSNYWLAQNLDVMLEVQPKVASLEYDNKYYLPLKMQSEVNKKSFDTFENRVVVGFIKMVIHNATNILAKYNNFVSEQRSRLDSNQVLAAQGRAVSATSTTTTSAPRVDLEHDGDDVVANRAAGYGSSGSSGRSSSGSDYLAPIVTLKYLQLGRCQSAIEKLQEAIAELNNIYLNYAKLFSIRDAVLQHVPRKAKAFQEIKPYAQVFRSVMRWFRYGDFSFEKDFLFLNVKTLDKVFEYYCLYRLLDMLVENGFKPIAQRASYNYCYVQDKVKQGLAAARAADSDPTGSRAGMTQRQRLQQLQNEQLADRDLDVANTYHLVRGKQQVTVYYQPIISNNIFENGIYAFRTTKSTTRTIANNNEFNFYCPDFILKFSSGEGKLDDDDYVIFDAKFSQGRNIITHYIDSLVKKYCIETAVAVMKKSASAGLNPAATKAQTFDSSDDRLSHQQMSNMNNSRLPPQANATMFSDGSLNPISFEFVGCKVPKMIFALQGRISKEERKTPRPAPRPAPRVYYRQHHGVNSSSTLSRTPSNNQPYSGYNSYNGYNGNGYNSNGYNRYQRPNAVGANANTNAQPRSTIWYYHNSPLAQLFPPQTSIGMVEMNTKVNSTPELWREIVRNLPYLQTDKDNASDEEMVQAPNLALDEAQELEQR